jgi:urease subunit alpha
MFGAMGKACHSTSMIFMSKAGVEANVAQQLGLQSLIGTVSNCRTVGKKDMVRNSYLPKIDVDAQTYEVRADGELLVCEPATELPLAQRYFLF